MLDFEGSISGFREQGVQVIAASAETLDNARGFAEELSLTFTVGYGLDAAETSELTGCFYDDAEGYLHATGFVVSPDGKIANAAYSTGPLGRLSAKDCLALIKYLREKA